MAWSLLANTAKGAIDPGTTAAIDTTGADLIVVVQSWFHASAVPTLTDSKSNTWHGLTQRQAGGNINVRMSYATAKDVGFSVGAGHTFTFGASGSWFGYIDVLAFSGSKTSVDPFDSESGNTATSATSVPAISVTPATSGCLIVSGLTVDTGTAYTCSGFTITENHNYVNGTSEGSAEAYKVQASGTESASWNWTTSGTGAAAIAAFTAAAAGGGGGAFVATVTLPLLGVQ